MTQVRDAFVIMPFSATTACTEEEWTEVFENVFRPALEQAGCTCERAVPRTGSLISSIVERLHTSWVVLADITDRNPNVFYELGVRHSLSRRTIIVSQESSSIPSDLRGYWALEYGLRPAQVAKFTRDISRIVSESASQPERSDSPVSDYLQKEQMSIYGHVQRDNAKKLGALFTELSGNIIAVQRLRDYKHPSITSQIAQATLISIDCLSHLLQTLYIDLGPDVLHQAYELMAKLRSVSHLPSEARDLADGLPEAIESFAQHVLEVRDKLVRGEYSEPAEISTLVWGAGPELTPICAMLRHAYLEGCKPDLNLPKSWPAQEKPSAKKTSVSKRKRRQARRTPKAEQEHSGDA